MTKMLLGTLVAVLAVGCASDQAQTRSTGAAQHGSATGGGNPDSTTANAEAASQRPSSGVGTQSPHPTVTDPNDPRYEGKADAQSGAVARPGLEGRPGFPSDKATTGAAASADVKELDEVYGQVNKVSGDEIEIEPAYGDAVKLKMQKDAAAGGQMSANAGALKEGDEVRASYDEAGGDKTIVDLKTGDEAKPIDSVRAPDTQYPATNSSSTSPSRTEAGMNSGSGTTHGDMSGTPTTR